MEFIQIYSSVQFLSHLALILYLSFYFDNK